MRGHARGLSVVPRLGAHLFAAVIIGLLATPLDGAPWPLSDYTITSWASRDGVSPPIWAIRQDKEGYLWVGTGSGLLRFDGHRFVAWDALGHGPLPGNVVLSLASARDGSLWVGFAEEGIGRLRYGVLTSYRDPAGLAFTRTLVEDRRGTIWAGTRSGLFGFDGTRWIHHGTSAGLPASPINGIYEDAAGVLWVRTLQGIYRRDPSGHTFVPAATTPAFREPLTSRAASRQHLAGGELTPFSALQDRRGDIWRGTLGQGLIRFRFGDGAAGIERVTVDAGLLSNVVGALYEDEDSNIWIGTQAGLHQLSPRKVTPVEQLGTVAVVQTTSDGSVWFGGDDGVIRMTNKRRRIYTEGQGIPPGPVRAIVNDHRGRLWVATDRGVACLVGERFSRVPMPAGHGFDRIISLSVDSHQVVWLTDIRLGLLRLQNGGLAPFDTFAPFQGSHPMSVYVDRADRVWMGFADGRLGRLGLDGRVSMHDVGLKGPTTAISEDPEGALLIGGKDGIARFADGKSVAITVQANGLPGSRVTAIIDDERGAVWAGTTAGIVRVERREFDIVAGSPSHRVRYMLYDETDGLNGMPVALASPAVARSAEGRLWFVTDRGATVVDPAQLGQAQRAPRVRIEEVRAGGRRFDPALPFRLGPRPERLEIDYTALVFSSPASVRFQYRLNGFDSDWQDAGSRRQASYTNLPPGEYSFQVVARDKQDSFDSSGAAMAFAIVPAFYQTSSFFASIAAVIVSLGMLAWRLRLRQIRKRFALVLAERARISREVHDTLLQSLAAVALETGTVVERLPLSDPTGTREQLDRLRKEVEEQIREARETIWNLRSPALERLGLAGAIEEAGNRIAQQTSASFIFSIAGRPQRCERAVEEQLLKIGHEALTNAARHARASEVRAELRYKDGTVTLCIVDNGIGFNADTPADDLHFGLMNMRERAAQVGGQVDVLSARDRGTQVLASFPIASHGAA